MDTSIRAGFLGSFDPATLGHLDLIQRASKMFECLVVGVGHNPKKSYSFTLDERLTMLKGICSEISNVEIMSFTGLAVDFCKQERLAVLVRGLRTVTDFDFEMRMAGVNHHLHPGVDSVFLPTRPEWMNVSSSMAKELSSFGVNVDSMVPKLVSIELEKKYKTLDSKVDQV